jgi:hypothetical protein
MICTTKDLAFFNSFQLPRLSTLFVLEVDFPKPESKRKEWVNLSLRPTRIFYSDLHSLDWSEAETSSEKLDDLGPLTMTILDPIHTMALNLQNLIYT